jgi:hypothetical protein
VFVDQFRGRLFLVPRAAAPQARELAKTPDDVGLAVQAALRLAWSLRPPAVWTSPDALRAAEDSRREGRAEFLGSIGIEAHEYLPEIRVKVSDNGRDAIRLRCHTGMGGVAKETEIILDRAAGQAQLGETICELVRDAAPSPGALARAYGAAEGRASIYSRLGFAYVCSSRRAAPTNTWYEYALPYARINLKAKRVHTMLGTAAVAALAASEPIDPAAHDLRDEWCAAFIASTGLARRTIFAPKTHLVGLERCGPEVRVSPTKRGRGETYVSLPDRETELFTPTIDELGSAIEQAITRSN